MRLYSGLSTDFIRDNVHNRIAEKLKDAFSRQYRHNPAPSEVNSWRNSLRAVSQVIDDADLHDHGILLEYQLPMSSSRLDCMITGTDEARRDNAVILELKQWETCGDVLFSDRFRSILDASPVFTADDRSGFRLDEDPDPSWAGPAVSAFVRIQRAVVGGASK